MSSVNRDTLIEYLAKGLGDEKQRRIAQLRLDYSDIGTLRNNVIASLDGKERVYPIILPTQASGRWSYLKPNISGFEKKCRNPECPKYLHEKTSQCWGARDLIIPDENTFWIEHDLDAVEHRIYCLVLNWKERLEDLKKGIDIHTPVACDLFNLPYPSNLFNPHSSVEDTEWRTQVQWGGKDDRRRTIGKNMTYGGQFFYVRLSRKGEVTRLPYRIYQGLWYNPTFVYTIPNINTIKLINDQGEEEVPDYLNIACRFVESNIEIQKKKAVELEKCRRDKVSRTLYGSPRYAWYSNQESAKYLFNHRIQGTVASYINESAILLQKEFLNSYIIHNQHDSLKWCFPYSSESNRKGEEEEILEKVKKICQRVLTFRDNEINITATFKMVRYNNHEI